MAKKVIVLFFAMGIGVFLLVSLNVFPGRRDFSANWQQSAERLFNNPAPLPVFFEHQFPKGGDTLIKAPHVCVRISQDPFIQLFSEAEWWLSPDEHLRLSVDNNFIEMDKLEIGEVDPLAFFGSPISVCYRHPFEPGIHLIEIFFKIPDEGYYRYQWAFRVAS